jgi:DNA-binding MarR family transcriptional regulator
MQIQQSKEPVVASPKEYPSLNCTCLHLRQASRHVSQIYDHHLRDVGLRNTQFSLIGNLTSGSLTINELSERLVLDPTTLSRNLKPLVERRLITVAVSERDRRERTLALTRAGREIYEEALPGWKAAQRAVRAAIGTDTRDTLHRLLQQLETVRA